MADLTHDYGHVLSAFQRVNPYGMVRLIGDECNKLVVAANVKSNVALGRFTLECTNRITSGSIPLDNHRVFSFVGCNDETLVSGYSRTSDDVHVALEVNVLFFYIILYYSGVRRGIE